MVKLLTSLMTNCGVTMRICLKQLKNCLPSHAGMQKEQSKR